MRQVLEVLGPVPVASLPFLVQKALSFSATTPIGVLTRSDLSPAATSASARIGSLMLTSTGTALVLGWPASRRRVRLRPSSGSAWPILAAYVTKAFFSQGGWRLTLCTRKTTLDSRPETSRARESMPSNRASSKAAAPYPHVRGEVEVDRAAVRAPDEVEGVAAFEG